MEAPAARVQRVARVELREGPVEIATRDRAAHHEVIAAPGVVGTASVGAQGPAEVRRRERGHLADDVELDQGVVELGQRRVDHGEHRLLIEDDLVVMVPAAELDEEGLALHAQSGARRDRERDHPELPRERRVRELRRQRRQPGDGVREIHAASIAPRMRAAKVFSKRWRYWSASRLSIASVRTTAWGFGRP